MYLKQIAEILVFDNTNPSTKNNSPPFCSNSKGPAPPTPNVVAVVYHGMTLPRWNRNNGWYDTSYSSYGPWGSKSKGTHGSLRIVALKLVSCFVFGKMSEVTSWTVVRNRNSKFRGAYYYRRYAALLFFILQMHETFHICLPHFPVEKTSSYILLLKVCHQQNSHGFHSFRGWSVAT